MISPIEPRSDFAEPFSASGRKNVALAAIGLVLAALAPHRGPSDGRRVAQQAHSGRDLAGAVQLRGSALLRAELQSVFGLLYAHSLPHAVRGEHVLQQQDPRLLLCPGGRLLDGILQLDHDCCDNV